MSKRKLKKRYNGKQSARAKSARLALEERIVFDAVLPVVAGDALDLQDDPTAQETPLQNTPNSVDDVAETFSESTAQTQNQDNTERSLIEGTLAPTNLSASEIIFIDAAVDGLEQHLIANPEADIVLIDSSTDGLTQIANVLAGRDNIDSIHIISHGESILNPFKI